MKGAPKVWRLRWRHPIQSRFAAPAALSIAVLTWPVFACADDRAQVFAGGQFDFSNYVFVGVTVALPKSAIGNGFAVRGLADTGGYNYPSTNLGIVKANFGGGELDAVYQITRQSFWSEFSAGINDTYTGLTPYDPGNPLRGEQVELRLSLDGGKVSGPWRADWFGYYGARLEDYEAMVGATHALSSTWRLGVEVYSEGNPTYSLYQVGPYAGFTFAKNSELQFSTGEAWQSGFAPRLYLRAVMSERL
jgi:Cellulose biosynthesis protein BcsS